MNKEIIKLASEYPDTYLRILPRDLFNESKLLKCMARVSLLILDHKAPDWLTMQDEIEFFDIRQDPIDGDIYIKNLPVYIHGDRYLFYTLMNNKSPYPLIVTHNDTGEIIEVLDDDGNFSKTFLNSFSDEK